MLQIAPQHKLWFGIEPVDFRRGIEGIAACVRIQLRLDPMSGHVFIFRNRNGKSVKILTYDGSGFWLCQKRFSSGKLMWWPSSLDDAKDIRAIELALMLQQGSPKQARIPEDWRSVS